MKFSLRFLIGLSVSAGVAVAQNSALPTPLTSLVFGQKIRYYDVGSGPVVVLLHGLGSSASGDWGRVIPPLAVHHRVVAPDQLGFGDSDKPVIDYRIQTWVDVLGEFLRGKNIQGFTLAGESLGGWIAAQYSIQSLGGQSPSGLPKLPPPQRLILCDAAGHLPRMSSTPAVTIDTSSLEGCRNLLSAIFYDPSWHSDAAVKVFFERSLAKGDGYTVHSMMTNPAVGRENVEGKLGSISVPTLVVWGDHDTLVPMADGKDYADKIPGAQWVVISKAGHAPCIERPDAFLAAILPFLDSGSKPGN